MSLGQSFLNSAETHETVHRESGMRYQHILMASPNRTMDPYQDP
jgi:hypothetical protein